MPHRPALALAATAIACAGVGVALPSSAQLVRAEPLGAVTTITATSSGTAEVVLYDDASLSPRFDHNPDISISGAGRVVGFRLTRADGGSDVLEGVRLPKFAGGLTDVGGSTNAPPARCAQTLNPLGSTTCTYPSATAITLHEGYYQLAVLTDGAPVRITLRLHGVERGRASVRMQKQVRTAEADLPARESIGTSTITYGASTTFSNAKTAQMVVRAKLHPDAKFLAASTCARQDSGAPPPYAFSPPCPGGSSRGMAWKSNNVVEEFGGVGGLSVFDLAGASIDPTGLGGSYVDSDGPAYLGGVGIWTWSDQLDLFGTPLTPVPGQ